MHEFFHGWQKEFILIFLQEFLPEFRFWISARAFAGSRGKCFWLFASLSLWLPCTNPPGLLVRIPSGAPYGNLPKVLSRAHSGIPLEVPPENSSGVSSWNTSDVSFENYPEVPSRSVLNILQELFLGIFQKYSLRILQELFLGILQQLFWENPLEGSFQEFFFSSNIPVIPFRNSWGVSSGTPPRVPTKNPSGVLGKIHRMNSWTPC